MSSTNDSGQQEILLNQELLNIYRRNLAHQLQRAARFGGEADAPLDVVNSILEQRNQIRQIKAILRANGVAVVDNPNDEPLSPTDTSQPRRRRRQLTVTGISGQDVPAA
jgi:hypothetical protein